MRLVGSFVRSPPSTSFHNAQEATSLYELELDRTDEDMSNAPPEGEGDTLLVVVVELVPSWLVVLLRQLPNCPRGEEMGYWFRERVEDEVLSLADIRFGS